MSNFSKDKTYALFASPSNKKLIAELSSQNIGTVIFPTITTQEINDDISVIEKLSDFDWLVFPDVYTVEYFVKALEKHNIDLFELDDLRVCAFGEAVSDRLRFSQLHADILPLTIKTSDILQSLKDYIFDEAEFENLRFLILKKQESEIEIVGELLKAGSGVTEQPVYSIMIEDENEIPKLKALIKGGAIDEFIFSTHLDVLNLAQLFQTENLADLLEGITLTATDKSTSQSLYEFRLLAADS